MVAIFQKVRVDKGLNWFRFQTSRSREESPRPEKRCWLNMRPRESLGFKSKRLRRSLLMLSPELSTAALLSALVALPQMGKFT